MLRIKDVAKEIITSVDLLILNSPFTESKKGIAFHQYNILEICLFDYAVHILIISFYFFQREVSPKE